MDKTNITGQLFYGILIVIGVLLFLWFCWPAVFKGILNTGNICGMAGAAICVYYGIRHNQVHGQAAALWKGWTGRLCLLLFLVLAAAAILMMVSAAFVIFHASSKQIPEHTPAVVLGCSVKGKEPSRILQERIDAACAYMKDHPQAICILSGGKGKGEDISEAACMYRELVEAGIDDGRLYQEADSVNTQQNLENSKKILDSLGKYDAVTIITSDFHLYRGRKWAQSLGYEDYGYAAHTDWRYYPTFFLREIIAVVHIWTEKSLQNISKYLIH